MHYDSYWGTKLGHAVSLKSGDNRGEWLTATMWRYSVLHCVADDKIIFSLKRLLTIITTVDTFTDR